MFWGTRVGTSTFPNRYIQIQYRLADRRHRRELLHWDLFRWFRFPDRDEQFGLVRVLLKVLGFIAQQPQQQVQFIVVGLAPVKQRNACWTRAASLLLDITLAANSRADSTNCLSFINTKACSGVFVRERFIVQTSRVVASRAIMLGSGAVRFQTEYSDRR